MAGKNSDKMYMEIGGVYFSVSSDTPHLLEIHETVYQPFIRQTKQQKENININIHIVAGGIPAAGGLRRIFDSGQSWSMYREGGGYLMVRQPQAFDSPIWAARFNRDMAEITVYCGDKVTSSPFRYPLDQMLLMYILSWYGGMVVHAAGMEIASKGLIFPGPSGAGKSTLSRQFVRHKDRREFDLLSDDRIIIRKIDGSFRAYGTPWPGEEGISVNKSMPLSAILFLNHGDKNRVEAIKSKEVLERLLRVSSIPWYDREVMDRALSFCDELITHIPCYDLHFTPDAGIVQFIKEFEL